MNRLPDPPGPDQEPEPNPQRLGPTTSRQLVVSALAGGVVGYFIVATAQLLGHTVPITPWSLSMALGALAVVALFYAHRMAEAVRNRREDISPEEGLRAVVLGKTMSLSGAMLAGGHLVYLLHFVDQWEIAGPQQRVIHGAVTMLLSAIFGWAGWRLEQACIVDDSSED